ncbi:hypothetical protein Pan241w_57660 [Gimesia alba]|uniref:Uncharacterized protein n=1 Tax=Gimesia alba TaxID=2527973 RepID=A0A517RP32_9PLAN|nr:hypothetical protein Pan241w_57660 [Gimesia alba]
MIFQSLRKHQITQPNIPWNSRHLRWLLAVALTLGTSPFSVAGEPSSSTDPFLSQSAETAQTWEELKSRSPEQRWESLSRESKRELKKQERKERREQRKSNKNSDPIELVPEFRKIPDHFSTPTAPTNPEVTQPASTPDANVPATTLEPIAEPFKTIGLEEKSTGTQNSTTNLKFNTPAPANASGNTNPSYPLFPEENSSGSRFINKQKTFEKDAASPGYDDSKYAGQDLEDETPHLLKKIAGISPFFDYEPDPDIAKNEPCRNLCPRPDGKPCKLSDAEGAMVMECPKEFQLSREPYVGRNFTESIYTWEASNLNYNPLYFEDPNLERYGNSRRDLVQPFVSIGRFTGQLLALPYQMSIDPVRKRIYPLGYYRPGEYTPKRINGIPWNTKAAITEGLTATGLVFILP